MTFRLVLVGLVAALGLTIPQWSNPTKPAGSPQTAKAVKTKERNKQTIAHQGRNVLGTPGSRQSASATASKKQQPIGYASGGIRPNSKAYGTFWQIPSGLRSVQPLKPAVSTASVSSTVRASYEPIHVAGDLEGGLAFALNRESQGLATEFQGPPSRLKRVMPVYQPIVVAADLYDGLAQALNRQAEGSGKLPYPKEMLRKDFRLVRQPMTGLNPFEAIAKVVKDLPPIATAVAPAVSPRSADGPTLAVAYGILSASVEGLGNDWIRKASQAGETVRQLDRTIRDRLALKPVAKPQAVVAEVKALMVEFATLPDDVFAKEIRADLVKKPATVVAFSTLPDDVFAPEVLTQKQVVAQVSAVANAPALPVEVVAMPAELVSFSALPDDVFAPEVLIQKQVVTGVPAAPKALAPRVEVVAKPAEVAAFSALPDDVFAPEVLTQKQIAAEEPAPEAPALPGEVVASPAVETAPTQPTAYASKSVEPKTTPTGATSPAQSKKVNESPSGLTKAVSLTRDAAVAWMKLLSSPAVVTLAR